MFKTILDISHYTYNPHAVPLFIAGVLIFLIGIFILIQTKKVVRNIAFFLFCMSLSLWLTFTSVVYLANDPEVVLWWYKHFVFLGVANIMPNFYLFSVATAGFLRQQKGFVIAGYILANIVYVLALTTNYFITTPTLYFWGYCPHYEPMMLLFFIPYAALFFASEIHLWRAYRAEKSQIRKNQILTIFIGLLIGFLASFDFVAKLWMIELYPFGFIPSFILSAMVAYSVIRHKAFDIETVIHKTIMWVGSFAIIGLPIFIMYRWVFSWIQNSFAGHLIFGVFSFIIFTIYMRMIQPRVDHMFQRRRADLEEISSQFVGDLVYLEGLDNLVVRLEETIKSALYPQWIDIFLFDKKKRNFPLLIAVR